MDIIIVGIIACEIGFWVVLALGLAARYGLRLKRTSTVILLVVPVLDVLLLSLIAGDIILRGATAEFAHGLGAIYLGVTVAFGHQIIRAIDARFAHRFAGAPAPTKVPPRGPAKVAHEWRQWLRMLLAAVIATVVLGGIILLAADPVRTASLEGWIGRVWLATAIWLVGWPVWETLRGSGDATTPDARGSDRSGAVAYDRS